VLYERVYMCEMVALFSVSCELHNVSVHCKTLLTDDVQCSYVTAAAAYYDILYM